MGPDVQLIQPQIELVLFGLGILLIDFYLEKPAKYVNAGLALVGTGFSGYTLWILHGRAAASMDVLGFKNSIIVDGFFVYFSALLLAATALTVLLSVRYLETEEEQHGEYYALMLFACAGMMFMASGIDIVVLFLGLETMAISFYVLTGYLRRQKRSNEAALKYVLLGAFSSGILAYGLSLLYGLSGSTNLASISRAMSYWNGLKDQLVAIQHNPGPAADQMRVALEAQFGHGLDPFLVQILPIAAFVTISVGLFFKIAAAPFHQWSPDVYEGAPTPITAYLSVASKTASFALLLRIFLTAFRPTEETWGVLVAAVAVVSLTWGTLAAITQTNVKRLLAYSSIAHVGYMLLGVVAGNETGIVGIAFYLFAYTFMTTGAFAVVIVLRRKGLIGEDLEDLNGLYQRSPAAAVSLLIFMLSLAGIPPTAGFLGKYFIFQSLIETKHPVLAIFAALYAVPALYYYFRIVVHAWLKQPGEAPSPAISVAQAVALGATLVVTLAAGVYPEPFAQLARYAFGLGH